MVLLQRRLQAERGKVAAAFSQLPQFLEKQEKLWQAPMEEVEKEIVRRRDEHQASLSAELSSLESLIQELEEKQQLPADELPQNLGDLLERCERESFENPEVFPESLKGRIRDLSNPNSSVEGITKRFQGCEQGWVSTQVNHSSQQLMELLGLPISPGGCRESFMGPAAASRLDKKDQDHLWTILSSCLFSSSSISTRQTPTGVVWSFLQPDCIIRDELLETK
ncbi:hypothetical protein lerEdw1_010478 [Lerista edwardsae]|nr:hypothetical protein lerEdw1_010478 [Lerista edwardsae]